ncbi:methyltransferase [Algihabitans albus]|uniref:methyltransferase n=1 Tax=Algihabitans albus TaxID=2164067 RepID=UPI000E5C879D|nr:methyltransferase [Algihabitans albus]
MSDARDRAGRRKGDPVAAQYEAYPYPARDPAEEAKRLIAGSPSRLLEIRHYLRAGAALPQGFRALVAGGGTGDGTVMLAQQLADAGLADAEVIYLDLSKASRAICEARVRERGLTNVGFHSGAIEDLARLDLGQFDYIDCCGVLHHLASPAEGLRRLTEALTPSGGLGVMVYGRFGRSGVYELQGALRHLGQGLDLLARVKLAKTLLPKLPATNRFRRNPNLGDHKRSDAELVDLLLHERDIAYSVPELAALVAEAGLEIAAWIEPLRYDPATYLPDELQDRLEGLNPLERATLAEQLAGNLKTHTLYLSRRTRTAAQPHPEALPAWVEWDGAAVAAMVRREGALAGSFDGLPLRLPLPARAAAFAELCDGRRSLAEIQAALQARFRDLPAARLEREIAACLEVFGGVNRLLLMARS